MTQDFPTDAGAPLTREQRLAAKLRENLRRRKAQARALTPHESQHDDPDNAALSKEPPKS